MTRFERLTLRALACIIRRLVPLGRKASEGERELLAELEAVDQGGPGSPPS